MAAAFTSDPCETAVKVAAIQIAMDDIYYMRSPEPKARGISIVPDLFEFFEMGFYALVVGAGGAFSALGTGELFAAAETGLRFLRRNYLMLQLVHNDMAEVFDLTLRWTRSLDDGSSRLTTIGEWHGGDHLRIFGIAMVNRGDRRSEFRCIFDYQLMAGIEYDF